MSAQPSDYRLADNFGVVRPMGMVKPNTPNTPLVEVPRAFPSAGTTGHGLRLISFSDEHLELDEDSSLNTPASNLNNSLKWLEDIYALVDEGDPDSAIDILFTEVDTFLSVGDFTRCDGLLRTIDPKRLDTNLLVAALSITKRAADKLRERRAFVQRVKSRLEVVAPDRAGKLLSGLD
jgi:hypothetical protein